MGLHLLSGLDYDEPIPEELREIWTNNLVLMHMSKDLEVDRSVVHEDAIDPDNLELICCADAATTMYGAAIYVRSKLKDGSYSVKLLTARSRTSRLTIPRNELLGCVLVSETAFVAVKSLGDRVKKIIFVTDSSAALCWISNLDLKLKQFVFARVQHIRRLIGKNCFHLIPGALNPADLVTRDQCTLEHVKPGSVWQDGEEWMKREFDQMPIKTYEQMCAEFTTQDSENVRKEVHADIPQINSTMDETILTEMQYCFCVQTTDIDIVEDAEIVCTESCKIPKVEVIVNGETKLKTPTIPGLYVIAKDIQVVKPGVSERKEVHKNNKGVYPIDFIKWRFRGSLTIIAYVHRFINLTRHKAHVRRKVKYVEHCKYCEVSLMDSQRQFNRLCEGIPRRVLKYVVTSLDLHLAWKTICKLGTLEVKEHYKHTPVKLNQFQERGGILYCGGRLEYPDMRIELETPMYDIDFFKPVFLNTSVVTYTLCMHIHWDIDFCPHSGVSRTGVILAKLIYVKNVTRIIKYIRDTCTRCRYLMMRHYAPLPTNQSSFSLLRAPPFFSVMCDIAGTFKAHDSVRMRVTRDCYFLVCVCMTTGATSIGVMEDLSTNSVVFCLTRLASRYGWPKYALFDCQTSFKTLEDAGVNFTDLGGKLWKDQKMILDFSTPHAHEEHGRVESKVKVLKEFLNKSEELGKKHSFLQWETIVSSVSAMINGLPICSNQDNSGGAYGELNLITPNLLLIGRNNNRAPEGFMTFNTFPSKALKSIAETNEAIYDLLGDFITRFIPGKRYSNSKRPELNDIVLILMKESQRTRNCAYKFGRIIELCVDGRDNKVRVEYQNSNECVKRTCTRNIQNLVLILGEDEVAFNTVEHHMAACVQRKYYN